MSRYFINCEISELRSKGPAVLPPWVRLGYRLRCKDWSGKSPRPVRLTKKYLPVNPLPRVLAAEVLK